MRPWFLPFPRLLVWSEHLETQPQFELGMPLSLLESLTVDPQQLHIGILLKKNIKYFQQKPIFNFVLRQ